MTYTREILEPSTLSISSKKAFSDGVDKGLRSSLSLVEGLDIDDLAFVETVKDIVKASLLWRLGGGEVRDFLEGFGRFISLGFSLEGAGEIVKRFIVREVSLSHFKKILELTLIAVSKYSVSSQSIEHLLRERLSMLSEKNRTELIRSIIDQLRNKIKEAKRK